MTPKEKAKELYNKYWDIDGLGYYRDEDGFIVWSTSIIGKQAKQCALIAIEEILKQFVVAFDHIKVLGIYNPNVEVSVNYNYWQEVKQEIEKL